MVSGCEFGSGGGSTATGTGGFDDVIMVSKANADELEEDDLHAFLDELDEIDGCAGSGTRSTSSTSLS